MISAIVEIARTKSSLSGTGVIAADVRFSSFYIFVSIGGSQLGGERKTNIKHNATNQFPTALLVLTGERVHLVSIELFDTPNFDFSSPPGHHQAVFRDCDDYWCLGDRRKG